MKKTQAIQNKSMKKKHINTKQKIKNYLATKNNKMFIGN